MWRNCWNCFVKKSWKTWTFIIMFSCSLSLSRSYLTTWCLRALPRFRKSDVHLLLQYHLLGRVRKELSFVSRCFDYPSVCTAASPFVIFPLWVSLLRKTVVAKINKYWWNVDITWLDMLTLTCWIEIKYRYYINFIHISKTFSFLTKIQHLLFFIHANHRNKGQMF